MYVKNNMNNNTTIYLLHMHISNSLSRVCVSRSPITTFHCAFLHVFSLEFFACCGNVLALCFN